MRKLNVLFPLVLILLLSACANPEEDLVAHIPPDSVMPSHDGTYRNASSPVSPDSDIPNSMTDYIDDDASLAGYAVLGIETNKFEGKISNLCYVKSNQVLIVAGKLYIYDLCSRAVIYQAEKTGLADEKYQPLDNGLAVIGNKGGGGGGDGGGGLTSEKRPILSCVVFDNELGKTAEIGSDIFAGADDYIFSSQCVSVSYDSKTIAYASNRGLYIYDIDSNVKTTLIDFLDEDAAKRSGLAVIEQVDFINNGKTILFKSKSFDVPAVEGKQSFDTYGTINTDGSGLSVNKGSDIEVKELIAYDTFAFLAEDFKTATGKVAVKDFSMDSSVVLNTKTQDESGSVFGSENGDFFATASMDDESVAVRVYERESGAMVMEGTVDDSEYISRVPQVYVFDDLRTCIVLIGGRQQELPTIFLVLNF